MIPYQWQTLNPFSSRITLLPTLLLLMTGAAQTAEHPKPPALEEECWASCAPASRQIDNPTLWASSKAKKLTFFQKVKRWSKAWKVLKQYRKYSIKGESETPNEVEVFGLLFLSLLVLLAIIVLAFWLSNWLISLVGFYYGIGIGMVTGAVFFIFLLTKIWFPNKKHKSNATM